MLNLVGVVNTDKPINVAISKPVNARLDDFLTRRRASKRPTVDAVIDWFLSQPAIFQTGVMGVDDGMERAYVAALIRMAQTLSPDSFREELLAGGYGRRYATLADAIADRPSPVHASRFSDTPTLSLSDSDAARIRHLAGEGGDVDGMLAKVIEAGVKAMEAEKKKPLDLSAPVPVIAAPGVGKAAGGTTTPDRHGQTSINLRVNKKGNR